MAMHVGRFASALAALVVGLLLSAAPAGAVPTFGGAFDLSDQPGQLTVDAEGNAWVLIPSTSDIARITPQGVVDEFNPAALSGPEGITYGPDGSLWVTQASEVVEIPPADPDAAVAHAVNDLAQPYGITAGPEGALWAPTTDKLIKIPPANPAGATALPIPNLGPRSISAGGGNLWISDFGNEQIVRSTPQGAATEFPVSGPPQGVAAGAGGQVAFTQPTNAPHMVGRITGAGAVLETPAPNTDPFGMTLGRDGNWYVAEFTRDVGRLTPNGDYSALNLLPANSGPRFITATPGGTLWISLQNSNQVARITGIDPPAPVAAKARIDKAPKKKVRTKRKRARVKFRFSSAAPAAKFECALRRKGKRNRAEKRLAKFRACSSPKAYKVRKGRYRFLVRVEGSSAKAAAHAFRVIRKRR